MIIQKVIRGIKALDVNHPEQGGINDEQANQMFDGGILCNWWRNAGIPSRIDIGRRLTETNLDWHQNHYLDPDPDSAFSPALFYKNTPFISTTAGCVNRDSFRDINIQHRAWFEALRFATDGWKTGGYLFYCHLFVLGKKSVRYEQFSEELRELNVYHEYSAFHPEGEVTAKIVIPGGQIEKWEYYDLATVQKIKYIKPGDFQFDPTDTKLNIMKYQIPTDISNMRELI